jgi:hypothetical protein
MNAMFRLLSFLGISAVISPSPEQAVARCDMSVYVPVAGKIEGWNPVSAPRVFEGEELYDLIDGGAGIFLSTASRKLLLRRTRTLMGNALTSTFCMQKVIEGLVYAS